MNSQAVIKKLINQYNKQNDTMKPERNSEYTYTLTEVEFDIIINSLKRSKKG